MLSSIVASWRSAVRWDRVPVVPRSSVHFVRSRLH